MAEDIRQPKPYLTMFTSIFEGHTQDGALDTLSRGLGSLATHIEHLVQEVDILRDASRFERAGFLLTLANEEIAKTYILLDMCRLDSGRHHSVLKGLCRAFYSHAYKLAYVQIQRPAKRFWDMTEFKRRWDVEIKQWFPSSGPESGVPDLPGNVYFDRDSTLYCEYFEDSGGWYAPNPEAGREKFFHEWPDLPTEFEVTQMDMTNIKNAYGSGMYDTQCLTIVNEEFKGLYVNDIIEAIRVRTAIHKLSQRIIAEIAVPPETLEKSALAAWPLYHFCSSGRGA